VKYLFLLSVLFNSLNAFAIEEIKTEIKNRKPYTAGVMSFTSVEDMNFRVKPQDVDYQFDLLGVEVQLKGFTDEYSKPFYADELEKGHIDD